jgi:hypothetical protein
MAESPSHDQVDVRRGAPVAAMPEVRDAGGASLLTLVDSLISERAVIVGSLPPRGRDLDLLVTEADEAALGRQLPDAGFLTAGGSWVRFRDCTVDVVDIVGRDTWGLPEEELSGLLADARPHRTTRSSSSPAGSPEGGGCETVGLRESAPLSPRIPTPSREHASAPRAGA